MHIFRGSGIRGLRGMSLDDGTLLRPMLKTSREDVDDYIKRNAVPYVLSFAVIDDKISVANPLVASQVMLNCYCEKILFGNVLAKPIQKRHRISSAAHCQCRRGEEKFDCQ